MDMSLDPELTVSVAKLTRDQKKAAATLGREEARYLVDAYYILQADRIRSDAQMRELSKAGEPHEILEWLGTQSDTLEVQIKGALDVYSMAQPVGQWMRSIRGVGPVIAAGMLAHIDIKRAQTAGAIWKFAGLVNDKWEKGQKRPWNASLKVLCWKLGESFTKQSGYDDCFYGKLYAARKLEEIAKNEAGEFAEQAKASLEEKNFRKGTETRKAYEAGELPDGRILLRAQRYAVKLFLAHLHEVWYWEHFKHAPPNPYPMAILGHTHRIDPPNMPI